MAPILYPPSLLSADQVLQHAYDDATQTLRTTATAVIVGQPITVEIDMADDSVRLGDGTDFFTSTTIGPKVGLDVNVINPVDIILTNDTNYGTVGANTLRTAAQIGNATGAADFGGGLTTAQTLRVVLPTDQTAIPVIGTITGSPNVNIHDSAGNNLTSQVNGGQRALDVGINVAGVQIDPRQIRALTAADIITAQQGTSPWVVSGTVAATQSGVWSVGRTWTLASGTDSVAAVQSGTWTVVTSSFPTTVDTNYGTVGASTIRTASQIGNATGAALFGAGTTTAQVLRVVLPTDQTAIPSTQSGTWTTGRTWALSSGTDSVSAVQGTSPWVVSGTVAATQSGAWTVTANAGTNLNTSALALDTSVNGILRAQGSTTSGETGPLVQGAVTTAAPTYTTGQTNPLSLTTAGALRVDASSSPISGTVSVSNLPTTVDTNYGTVGASTIRSAAQIGNTTGAALFGAGTTTAQVLRVVLPTDQTAIPVTQSTSPWVVSGTVAATQSGTWTTGRTWTLASGTDSIAAVQSGTWTVTANAGTNLNTSALALESGGNLASIKTNTDNLNLAQASTTSGQKGNLILGAVTTAAPTYTTAQSNPLSLTTAGALRVDASGSTQPISGTVTVSNLPTTVDTNYGTVGASTLRSAAQIGNATGAALFGAGTTTAQVLRVVLPTDQTAIPVTQSGAWTVTANAGTNLNTSALALDTSVNGILRAQGSTTSGETGPLIQGAVTTAAPTYTTAQTNPLSLTTAGALRVDGSGSTQPISGTVAATQSGAWTTGRTWTLASGTDSIAAVQSGTWNIGTVTTITNPVAATQSGTWTVQQGTPPWSVVGAAASGASKSGNPVQIGSVFNTTQPTVTTGQAVESQATARGGLIVATGVDAFNINNITGTVSLPTGASTSALQTTGNTSLSTIATNTASLILAQGSTTSGQTGNLIMGAVTTAAPTYTTAQTSPLSLTTSGALRVDASGASLSATVNQGTANTVANGWPVKITDGTDTALVTANSDLKVVDGLRNGGTYSSLSVPTANTPVEAKVGASRLTNRKCLIITPNNAGMFWGLDSSVTTTSGQPLSNGQSITFEIDPDSSFAVFLVGSTNGKTANITEIP